MQASGQSMCIISKSATFNGLTLSVQREHPAQSSRPMLMAHHASSSQSLKWGHVLLNLACQNKTKIMEQYVRV